MRSYLVLIMIGTTLLVVSPGLALILWIADMGNVAYPELSNPIAILIAGAIALVSLTAASYLSLKEWKKRRP